MIRALIVDDDLLSRESLRHLLSKEPDVQVEGALSSALEARGFLQQQTVDLLFLDVEMPELSGLELLAALSDPPAVVLTTQDERYAVQAFDHAVLDFLVKPIRYARLIQSIERYKKERKNPAVKEDFYVRSEGKFVRIPLDELEYLETLDDYLSLWMKNGQRHLVHSSLKKMLENLPEDRFMRVHRSYVVNLKRIVDIDDHSLVVGKKPIPVARAYRVGLRQALGLKD